MNSATDNRPGTKPRRAEPLQPDRPGRGDDALEPQPEDTPDDAQRQAEQSRDALDNVRKGYD